MIKENTIGVAFLGLGRMGETFLRNLTAISGVKVVVVADPARERAERGRAMTGAEVALTDPEKASGWQSITWSDSLLTMSHRKDCGSRNAHGQSRWSSVR